MAQEISSYGHFTFLFSGEMCGAQPAAYRLDVGEDHPDQLHAGGEARGHDYRGSDECQDKGKKF